MSERILTVGGSSASKPISDFLQVTDYQGPKAGTYYVDLNVAATGGGSPDHPFATVAEAITASNASIGLAANRWWARRNRIFICGDGITEDLTVLPEKCDLIGVGSDLHPFPRIVGVQHFVLAKVGVRFINLGFYTNATSDLMSFPAGCHGLQILDCFMHPGTTSTKAIEITDSAHVRILRNRITVGAGDTAVIFGVGISIEGTASIHDFEIADNFIFATAGIAVANGTTQGSNISRNTIRVIGGLAINDDSDDVACVNNRLISSNGGLVEAQFCDWNRLLAVGNICTSDTAMDADIPTIVVLTS